MRTAPQSSRRPLLSVVIPSKNSSRWLDELLTSVIGQSIPDMEVLVVDNRSEDDSERVVHEHARANPNIRLLRSEAANTAGVRNVGVAAAVGEYLVFADSDDIVPDGAYRAMLESLEMSGSDMVIGDHLKFSPTHTWSPTRRWHQFDHSISSVPPRDVPELLSGRACWNRMFRRSFWDRARLRFPEVASVEDIEPMTRAFTTAERVDVVPECVYLYRDRGDSSSLSQGANAAVTTRYLEQELACVELVRDDLRLQAQHSEIVLDADGWSHLHRFLLLDPGEEAVAEVARATARLLAAIPLDALAGVAPIRRALWELVLRGEWAVARRFVRATTGSSEADRIGAWGETLRVLMQADASSAVELAIGGLLPALVNGAEVVDYVTLSERLSGTDELDVPPAGDPLSDAMRIAVRSSDAAGVSAVSGLRHVVPLVVAEVESTSNGLSVSGAADLRERGTGALLHLSTPTGDVATSTITPGSDPVGWRAEVCAAGLEPARYSVSVEFEGIDGRFPVVTARMPLPPVAQSFPLQPLADRKDGWRFLVDRRPMQRGRLGDVLARAARRLRRPGSASDGLE